MCTVRFSKAKKFSTWRKLKMNDDTLSYEDSMKYLGVTLHKSLRWEPHVHERIKKSTKTMNLANAAIGQKWGFNPTRAVWVYTAMARSVSTYGAITWSPYVTNSIKAKLSRLQRKAMLSMTSSMRSTPTTGLEAVLGLQPLDLHAHQLGTSARLRTRHSQPDRWDGVGNYMTGHKRLHDNILDKFCPKTLPIDTLTRQRLWIEDDEVENPDIVLYTDGSKMECGTGCGWAACSGDTVVAEESTYLGNDASVFQAEIIAISQGVRWILDNCENKNVIVYSDSQAALKAIFNAETTSKVVMDCKEVLRSAKENHRIALRWIKGHADHTGNELADHLAKKGSEMKCDSVHPIVPVPLSLIKEYIKKHFLMKWQTRWSEEGPRQSKIFYPTIDGRKLKKLSLWSRNNLNLLVQIGTGHALVAHHISKWTETEDICKLCEESHEDTAHLYFRCPALELFRREQSVRTDTKERKLVTFFRHPKLLALFEFRAYDCTGWSLN